MKICLVIIELYNFDFDGIKNWW